MEHPLKPTHSGSQAEPENNCWEAKPPNPSNEAYSLSGGRISSARTTKARRSRRKKEAIDNLLVGREYTQTSTLLTFLKKRADEDWLIGYDSRKLAAIAEEFYLKLSQQNPYSTPPKIILAERDPAKFIAGFIAAVAAGCPLFLCNRDWVQAEWQQVFELVQPDIILGEAIAYQPPDYPNIQNPLAQRRVALSKIQNRIMIPTGGSSGKIRFAIHTWETLMASVQGFTQYFQTSTVNSFCVLPLYHVSGLMQFLRSFTTGGRLVILPFKAVENDKQSEINPADYFISLVPTQLQRLLHHDPTWLSHFQTVLLGGAPSWKELLETARHHRIRLAPTYGMTETASQIVTLKPDDFLKGTNNCGQVLPHATVTIRSHDGEILAPGKIGTIHIKANSLALGYYPNSSLTKESGNRKVFQPDDLGFFDDRGYLNIIGRNSNKIITGGENVFPSEVEAAIQSTNLVSDVCVIGLPDRHWGQAVTAIYVPKHSQVSTEILQTEIQHKLSKFKRPKNWYSVEHLPRNSQGKINHLELLQIATLQPT